MLVVLSMSVVLSPLAFQTPRLMSSKRQKLPAKRSRSSEDPTPTYDVTRFVNASATDRFGVICKNRSFIKEKGFRHPDDFFAKTIVAKGWRALCQPPHPAAMSVV